MALIKCRECGREVSSSARSCPQCGCPVAAPPVVTEQTAKKHKRAQLIALAVACAGLVSCAAGSAGPQIESDRYMIVGGLIVASLGIVGYLIARILAWWDHG